MRRRQIVAAGSALTCLSLAGCQPQRSQGAGVTSQLNTSSVNTFGVGRFLIDLPDHFQFLANGYVEITFGKTSDFYTIEARAVRTTGATPTFDSIVAQRISELRAKHHFKAATQTRFIASRRISDQFGSPVVVRSYDNGHMLNSFNCEIYVEHGHSVTVLSRKVYSTEVNISPDAAEAQLAAIALKMRQLDSAGPAGPGLGLGKALLDSTHDGEYVSMSFRSTLWPETLFSLGSRSLLTELDGGLLKRVDQNSSLLATIGFRSQVLRRGTTTLGGAPAEELLQTGKDRGKTVRSFMAEVLLRQPATFALPLLNLDAKMGGQVESEYVEPKLSETEAIALWDFVRASVRPRPGAI